MLTEIVGVAIGAIVATWLRAVVDRTKRRREARIAAAALRFEVESNHLWLPDLPESRVFLRDEAWVAMKNKGYVAELEAPLPVMIAEAYGSLHHVNEVVRRMKKDASMSEKQLMQASEKLEANLKVVRARLDAKYKRLAKHFKDRTAMSGDPCDVP